MIDVNMLLWLAWPIIGLHAGALAVGLLIGALAALVHTMRARKRRSLATLAPSNVSIATDGFPVVHCPQKDGPGTLCGSPQPDPASLNAATFVHMCRACMNSRVAPD